MAEPKSLKLESLHRCKSHFWNGSPIVRIVKRTKQGTGWWARFNYFVGRPGDPVGYGIWVGEKELIPLSCLELLALEAEEDSETVVKGDLDLGKN